MSEYEKYLLRTTQRIIEVLEEHANSGEEKVLVGELMPEFIQRGIFEKDYNKGNGLRKFLNNLQSEGRLGLIPYAKKSGNKWHFIFHASSKYDRSDSDEKYVVDICDRVIGECGLRQHRFDFLKGKRNLPVDIFYPKHSLVIEFMEEHHSFQKFNDIKNYDELKRKVLRENGIVLLEIEFLDFAYNSKYRIIRREMEDVLVVDKLIRTKINLE